ncbi:uncharacterized protein B0H18DRAFT_952447 [Fomitopsis serialis]|uniref:uncharacterized protein n=1 Tax=Fomitopsis serialis TaxID=139415 RepID=UPI002008965B|nr:uncharacterized protein B0H18DRAFT_952447 [Neoantrodia serialis]KAH9932342.1 hypothetical protein B0H18DRAFT_952447 [Neoantrodia serialis]
MLDQRKDLEWTRDEDFWYEDGSIIVVAQTVGFRIYRGLLAKHCGIFRELSTVPPSQWQPPAGQLVCGCPVVQLTDTPVALRELLSALMYAKRYVPENDLELDALSYRIRLAHKYGAEDLLKESTQQLQALYPTSFMEWEKIRRPHSSRAITAVNLAHLTSTPSILPTALYACCQLPDDTLLEGAVHSDGTADTLSRSDLVKCMKAKVMYARSEMDMIHEKFRRSCLSAGDACDKAFNLIREAAIRRLFTGNVEPGILEPWREFLNARGNISGTRHSTAAVPCRRCLENVINAVSDVDVEWWCELPWVMGIEVGYWQIQPEHWDP